MHSNQSVTTDGTLWPSLAMIGSSIFWGSMWYALREVEAAGIPAALAGALCYGVPLIPLLPFLYTRRHELAAGGWRVLLCGGSLACCNIFFAVAVVLGEVGIIILLFYLSLQPAHALCNLLRKLAVVPEIRLKGLVFQFFQFITKMIQVKDTRRLSSDAPRQLPVHV